MIEPSPSVVSTRDARIPLIGPLLRGVLDWFRDVPIADPVDRRNAPMIQVISLLLAMLPPLAWIYRASVDIPWRPGEIASMVFSLAVSAAAGASFWLIRRGRFGAASYLLLAVFAVTVVPSYLSTGFDAQVYEQPILVIWMAIAGLVIGRRALWVMFACIAVAFCGGMWLEIARDGEVYNRLVDLAARFAMFLMIAVVLDRSSVALRESLREANQRGNALAESNRLLEQEARERERAQEQLIHAQKVEAVGRLASGVAHDFGNLLSLILGYAGRGKRQDDPAALKEALAGVESAARRATLVTHKLLAFARQDETHLQTFDAGESLRELRPMLRQLFDPTVDVRLDVAEGLRPIRFDRTQFELMVLNIAANANHAMPGGGVFEVTAGTSASGVAIGFRDTGTGMTPEVQARAFDPFFTTKPAGEGTGLGLSVARDLIQRAGGRIGVDSVVGAGTVIRIELPVAG
ncbi:MULTISPECIES: ATP-binding protein [unclassified Pseudoxanthomonas]|uniref:sensor histidine kinase n=1 Tax=unclassified Pseudoxanthomonas TaxID=2645906 RepID=UPI0016090A71|nr:MULTISPECIES: ATP-binding protein [unclassified Pseudoxanthomonas]MBB3274380.1 signal transduction histidine kinase [Pseudoxanthomonas sp. OG2]MBV7474886.1 histidine kinase [Pseudoxanthomonas sp. PXM05]